MTPKPGKARKGAMNASRVCFYCFNLIEGRHVNARIRHHQSRAWPRDSDCHFHPPCFQKFVHERTRPQKPDAEYEVLDAEDVES